MTAFLISLAVLIGGYFLYGAFVDKIMATDKNRQMPAYTKRDDVDYLPMKPWKIFMIQFLNIAGLGPIFGAIMGIMFGPAAFLWIALGTIFAGAVHDFCSGVISIRMGGASLPEIIGSVLGNNARRLLSIITVLLLLLVTAVFVITPAGLLASLTPSDFDITFWTIAIFIYYILATLLPIDKLIGNLYPIFGGALLFMALGILCVMLFSNTTIPVSFTESFDSHSSNPVFPMMFVSIACGAISGFHSTQSPMMARCLTNEKLARPIFYGAMVAEGIVALIWAAAAVAFTGGYEQLAEYFASGHTTADLVNDVSFSWLGKLGGVLAILGVVAAPITTGDTALRSARLTIADFLKFEQKSMWSRLIFVLPMVLIIWLIMQIDFQMLWRYFAWCNQVLSVITLWGITVYLSNHKKPYIISLIPALFMTVICTSYILYAPRPEGLGLSLIVSQLAGMALASIFAVMFFISRRKLQNINGL